MLQIGPSYPYANGNGSQAPPAGGNFPGFSPQQAAANGWAQQ